MARPIFFYSPRPSGVGRFLGTGGSLPLAPNGPVDRARQCLLMGMKRTQCERTVISGSDPKRTFDTAAKQKAPDDAGALNFIRSRSDQYFALTGPLPHEPKR